MTTITVKQVQEASEGWTSHNCIDILIEASRTKTRLGIISEMMTNLPSAIIDRDKLYHSIKIQDAKIKYAKLRLYSIEVDNASLEETNHHLDLMVERFGIEPLVEMIGEEE